MFLGIYQLLGGLLGIGLIIQHHYTVGGASLLFLFLPVLAGLCFLYSILCGVLCLRNHELALSLSFVNQLLQLIGLSVSPFLFDYSAGLFVSLNINPGDGPLFGWESGLSRMHFRYDAPDSAVVISINFAALVLLLLLDFARRKQN